MGTLRVYDKDGVPDTSAELTESGEGLVTVDNDLIYSGPFKTSYVATNTTVFDFNGADSDMKGNWDFMVIWSQNWQMAIYPDASGNIRTGEAMWVQSDSCLDWDETPETPEEDILVPFGSFPGEGPIADMLGNLLLEDVTPDLEEIASKVYEMIQMVSNWSNSDN